MISVRAHFDGKNLILEEPVDLPVNQPLLVCVRLLPLSKKTKKGLPKKKQQSVLDWIVENRIEDDDLPTDLAYQHDHYLYGTPKKAPPKKKPSKS